MKQKQKNLRVSEVCAIWALSLRMLAPWVLSSLPYLLACVLDGKGKSHLGGRTLN